MRPRARSRTFRSTAETPPRDHRGRAAAEREALFEEYRQVYELARFRLQALDRRAPVAAAAGLAWIASLAVLTPELAAVVLWAVPLTLVGWVNATITHARSFEDALRAIESIEGRVNAGLGTAVLGFQSRHPSRGSSVGGRTGRETVEAVLAVAGMTLGACLYLGALVPLVPGHAALYAGYVGAVGALVLASAVRGRAYRFRPSPRSENPLPQ